MSDLSDNLQVLSPFFIGGVCQGINDSFFSNNSMFSLFYGIYMTLSALGLDVSWIPMLIPTSGYYNPVAGTVTTFTFLIGICACIILGYLIGQYGVKKSKKANIILIGVGILVFSATWDMVFTIILFQIWNPTLLGIAVDWLPPLNLFGQTVKITFSWEAGVWLIFVRYLIAIAGFYYVSIKMKTGFRKKEIEWGVYW